mmetsp:Transcript_24350/g.76098  ORF Transcript_24350/g.76098 Transcript_24350/m.76098 type:complete len:255 (+) Transcript_24350:23-787(+)
MAQHPFFGYGGPPPMPGNNWRRRPPYGGPMPPRHVPAFPPMRPMPPRMFPPVAPRPSRGGINPTTGHDYRRGDDGSIAVDVPRVDSLLARRLSCKMSGKYDEADRLRDELREVGVEVQDKLKIWRVARAVRPSTRGLIDPHTGHDYQRSPLDRLPVDATRVHSLLAQRLQCKMGGDYTRADQLRQQLRLECGVEVNDRDKVWQVVVVPDDERRHEADRTPAGDAAENPLKRLHEPPPEDLDEPPKRRHLQEPDE